MAENEEELKILLIKVKEKNEKAGLKLHIQKRKIMAFSPITSWQIDGETMETVTDFNFLDSKIIGDGACSHEIKRHLLLGRKAMTSLDSIFKSRHYLADTGPYSQSHVFSSYVWMWELDWKESWAPKNGCFWTMMLEKTLESPLDSKEIKPFSPKGNQSWIYSLEGLMLKLQYFGHLMRRTDSFERPQCWERLKEERGQQKMRWLDGITTLMDVSLSQWTWVWASSGSCWWTGKPGVLLSMGLQRVRHRPRDWTELKQHR